MITCFRLADDKEELIFNMNNISLIKYDKKSEDMQIYGTDMDKFYLSEKSKEVYKKILKFIEANGND